MAEANKDSNQNRSTSESPQIEQTRGTAPRSPQLYRQPSSLARSSSPFSLMQRFMNDMDRWFGDFGASSILPSFDGGIGRQLWAPQIDVFERDQQLIVHADLPGLRQEDVKVNVDQGLLTISGQRTFEQSSERDKSNVYHRERSFGSFQRSIALPEGTDTSQIRASFENGVLEVRVPVSEPARQKGRDIPIGPKMPVGGAKH
jgi:HSP20 family protein